MAESQFLQSSFTSGELSPLLKGRTDLNQYYAGVQTAENVVIVPQGGLKRRPGTEHIDEVLSQIGPYLTGTFTATMPNGGTPANINDFNPATVGLTTTNIGTSGTGSTEYIVAHYNMASTSSGIRFIDVQDVKLTVDNANTANLRVQTSSNNTVWVTQQTIQIKSQAQSFRIKVTDTIATPYVRLVRQSDTGDLGTQRISLSEFNVMFETTATSDVKTFDFSIESDRHYVCVATGGANTTPSYGNMAFYRIPHAGSTGTVLVGNIPLPYKSTEIATLRDAQTENVMLMFHEEHPSKRIINSGHTVTSGNDSIFQIDSIPFSNVPQFDYDDTVSPTPVDDIQVLTFGSHVKTGDTYQIDVEGVLSKNITFAGDANANEQSSTRFNLEKNLQEMPVYGETGVSVTRTGVMQYTVTVSGESTKDFELYTGFPTSGISNANQILTFTKSQNGSPRKEDVWSATRGYPKMGTFHGGRLWLGGTKSKQQSLFASKSGSFFDYFFEEGDDDEGIFVTLTNRVQTEIVDINSDRGLQVFTTGGEFLVKGGTPSTIDIVSQTQHGSAYLEAKSLDGATLFVDQNGQTLRQFVFSFNEDAYTSNDISVLSSQLINQPKDVAVLSGTTSEDSNWVFIINQDGNGAVLNTVRAQDINGFTRWTNAGSGYFISDTEIPLQLVSASTVKNELYMVNKFAGGTSFRYSLERWSFDHLLDSSIKMTNVSATTVQLPDDHLRLAKVSVIGNGNNLDKRTVSATGQITLTAEELSGGNLDLEVGLNFTPKIVPMPLNTSSQAGANNAMREKRINRMNLRMYESAGVYIDGNPVAVRNFGDTNDSPLGTPFEVRTGIIQDNNGGKGWGIDVVPEITVPDPAPIHLQAIEYEVESS
tara:strand:- start:12370 stop:14997 length:2628 start_codon:yes stop_codon:yes gene_type:complete